MPCDLEERFEFLQHAGGGIHPGPFRKDLLCPRKDLRFDYSFKRLGRANPFFLGIRAGGSLELLRRAIVDHGPRVTLVDEDVTNLRAVPSASARRRNAVAVQAVGNGLLVSAAIGELVENPPDNGDFPFIAQGQRNTLVLNALPFPRLKDLDRLTGLVEQEAAKTVSRFSAGPVALLGNLHAAAKHLVAQFAAVLRGTESFKLDIDRVERIVLPRLAERRIDDFFAVFPALGAVLSGKVDVLEPAPAADVQAEDVLEVVPLLHPVLHHVLKAWPSLGRQPGLAGIHEFVDDFHAVAFCPGAYLILLNRDRVLLAVLCRMSVVRDRTEREYRLVEHSCLDVPTSFPCFVPG